MENYWFLLLGTNALNAILLHGSQRIYFHEEFQDIVWYIHQICETVKLYVKLTKCIEIF